jgi:hypothetical protein
MAMARRQLKEWVSAAADTTSWCVALSLVAMLLVVCTLGAGDGGAGEGGGVLVGRGAALSSRPCEEIYVVAEGETLHSISDKCTTPTTSSPASSSGSRRPSPGSGCAIHRSSEAFVWRWIELVKQSVHCRGCLYVVTMDNV